MCRHTLLVICGMVLGAMLSACQFITAPKSPACDALAATPLQVYVGQTMTLEEVVDAVTKAYGISRDRVSVSSQEGSSWLVRWDQNGLGYGVLSSNGTTVERIGIDYDAHKVTVGQFLDCIQAQPEWYRALYGSNPPTTGIRYAFDLYFPAKGIVVTGTGSDRRQQTPPPLNSDSVISRVFIGTRDSLPALYKQRWGDVLEGVRTNLRPVPWPGSWEAVRYSEDREMGW